MKFGWKLVIVAVLLIALGSLFFLEDRFMGNVVWGPSTVVDSCSDSDIIDLWDEVFVESSLGITILKNDSDPSNCREFLAYKTSGDQNVKVLYSSSQGANPMEVIREGVLQTIANSTESIFQYINGTLGFESRFLSNFNTFASGMSYLSGQLEDINNWTVSLAQAETKYQTQFDKPLLALFVDDPFSNGYISSNQENIADYGGSSFAIVGKNETFMMIYKTETFFENVSIEVPTFLEDISNFTFELNSDWNSAFALADHFDFGEGVNIGVAYWGDNNTGGEWINASIVNGEVRFKPAADFLGSREFRLEATSAQGNVFSNYFWVEIVEDVNDAPVFQGPIGDMILTWMMNVTIFLDQFFVDPEGVDLTYSAPDAENVSVVFSGNQMYVWLKPGFTGLERFAIIASDGVHQTSSNRIRILLYGKSNEGDLPGDFDNNTLLLSPGNISALGALDNKSLDKFNWEWGSGMGFWIMISVGILLGCLIIGEVVYFVFFDKGPVKAPVENTSVKNYLSKIKGVPVKGVVRGPVKGVVKGPVKKVVPVAVKVAAPVRVAARARAPVKGKVRGPVKGVARAPVRGAGRKVPAENTAVKDYLKKIGKGN